MAALGAFFCALRADLFPKRVIDALPEPQLLPKGKVIIHQAPSGKVMRQVAPRATGLCHIHDRVENLPPLITWWPAQTAPLRQILPDNAPFSIANVAIVRLSVLHPKPCSKSFALVQVFSPTFFTAS
jgi:hypothetical protein